MKTIKRLFKYLLKYKWLMLLALALSVGSNMFALLGPKLSGYAIDCISGGEGNVDMDGVLFYCGIMAVFYVLSSVMSFALSALMIHITQKVVKVMRKDVYDSLMQMPVSYFDTHQAGEIISHISYDIDTVNTSLSTDLIQICTSVITVVGSFIMMCTISPELVCVFLITIPMAACLTKFITGKTRPLFRKRSAALGRLNGFVEEKIAGHRTIKAYHQEENTNKKFDEKNLDAVTSYYKADYYGSTNGPCINFINNLSLAFISVLGSILYLTHRISIGNISSFVLYSRKFSGPINEFANIMNEFQSSFAAAERVFNIIDQPHESQDKPDAIPLSDVKGNVELKNVSFGYTKEKMILNNVNLFAPQGKMIAIVGPTGAGKTTIINLLMRFYDADSGNISIDGNNIYDVTRKSLRKSFAMVLQDTWLFNGTVFENVAYGKKDATMDDVVRVCKMAGIHSFIMGLKEGYNTILTEEGTNISKGQKQLLTIARAMLLDVELLILDEATSNVDIRTEARIQAAMLKLMENKTCFVIAHRLSTIKNADCIIVVNDGEIKESGTHFELLEKKGLYNRLYMSQFE